MMRKAFLSFALTIVVCASYAKVQGPIGSWKTDNAGLPCFEYTGKLPYRMTIGSGDSVKLNPDPWFVLGNHQMTVFAHVSGQYELITGQRAWARMNQGVAPNTGHNDARVEVIDDDGETLASYTLVGMKSLAADPDKCRRFFGCGYAVYQYQAGSVQVERTLSTTPSTIVGGGASAFMLRVTLKNKSRKPQHIRYTESIRANYETMMQQRLPHEYRKVKYLPQTELGGMTAKTRFRVVTDDPMLFASKDDLSKYEGFPPELFVRALTDGGQAFGNGQDIGARYEMTLGPREQRVLQIVIGYDMERPYSNIEQVTRELIAASDFSAAWREVLPSFPEETDADLRSEMTWHAYMLEAMATYSDYYGETKIPQGTIYDYDWGQHASARDNFQHALAAVYYRPELAKSILRYMLKRTRENGEILLIEYGNGHAEHTCYQTSDQQLWFFLLLSEYLKVTSDYAFLDEPVCCYPVKNMPRYTVLEHARHCFDFLRNQIGTGEHGLIRLLNSDWCDAVFYTVAAPYNSVQPAGESHMNTAMACAILDGLHRQLQEAGVDDTPFLQSIEQFRSNLLDSYLKDWGERTYPRRMYFAGKAYGDDQMFLDHVGFTLQIPELSTGRKQNLYGEMRQRLYQNEKLGAREQERPELTSHDLEPGSRENGGFWYSLNGPAIIGVATFDLAEAWRVLRQMTLANHARQFPLYWSGYWSAADNIESSLMPTEGLPDQTWRYADIPIACAHPHAWILYCYYKLKNCSKLSS